MKPEFHVFNHTTGKPVHLKHWQSVAEQALPRCLAAAKGEDAPLSSLPEIEISFVSDEAIAQVHADFMDDPTPTDVITVHHGEILISLDTAQRQALEHGETYEREVALYIIHGLLHLAGWDDREEAERKEMHDVQARILEAVGT